MSYTCSAQQTVKIGFRTTKEVINSMCEDYDPSDIYDADWEEGEEGEYVLVININGNVKCYPSNSYFDPDEYEFDEQFFDSDDTQFIKDCFIPKDMEDKVTFIWASEVDYY